MSEHKKILFILGVLDSGGVAKSLVNLLNVIDLKKYDISLLLCSNEMGPYKSLLPPDVHVITSEIISSVSSLSGSFHLLRRGHILMAMGVLLRMFVSLFDKAYAGYILSRLMSPINGEYDLIVDYNGQQQTYYMVDKLQAKKKVAFFHSDYEKWPYYYKMDKRYYPKLDAIFTVSQNCVNSLKRYFPQQSDKIQLMENILSVKTIESMAEMNVDVNTNAKWLLLTVGHVCKDKGTDLAIKAGKLLKDKGIDYTWCFIGSTSELYKFESLLKECGVSENFRFLGLKSNPYPYFNQCDIVVHPSLFEGKSVALDEAKLLCKPVVVTNFSTVNDQFEDGVNANVVSMTPESVSDGIIDLLNNTDKRLSYVSWLKCHRCDNSSEVEKLYRLIE